MHNLFDSNKCKFIVKQNVKLKFSKHFINKICSIKFKKRNILKLYRKFIYKIINLKTKTIKIQQKMIYLIDLHVLCSLWFILVCIASMNIHFLLIIIIP